MRFTNRSVLRLLDLGLELRLQVVELFTHLGSLVDVFLKGGDGRVDLIDRVLVDCPRGEKRNEGRSVSALHDKQKQDFEPKSEKYEPEVLKLMAGRI